MTVMLSVSILPRSSVTVRTYVVVTSGVAVGFSAVVLERPSAGDHSMLYGETPPVATMYPLPITTD